MALLGQRGLAVGVGHQRVLLRALQAQGIQRRDLVAGVAHRIQHGGVVAGDGGVLLGGAAAQVGAQPAAVEQRQVQRRAGAVLAAAALEEIVQPDRVQADEGREADARIELRACDADVLGGGLDPGARSGQVRATAQQVQMGRLAPVQRGRQRRIQRRGGRRPLPRQRGDLVAQQRLLLAQHDLLALDVGQRRLRHAQVLAVVQAGGAALAHQVQALVAQGLLLLQQAALRLAAGQRDIGLGDGVGHAQPRGGRVGLGGALLAQRRLQRGVVLAEEVELVAQAGLDVGQRLHAARQRRRVDAVLAEALARRVGLELRRRPLGGLGVLGQRRGAGDAGPRQRQRRRVRDRLVDQRVQLRIAEGLPPLRVERLGRAGLEAQAGGGLVAVNRPAWLGQLGNGRAGGEHHQQRRAHGQRQRRAMKGSGGHRGFLGTVVLVKRERAAGHRHRRVRVSRPCPGSRSRSSGPRRGSHGRWRRRAAAGRSACGTRGR